VTLNLVFSSVTDVGCFCNVRITDLGQLVKIDYLNMKVHLYEVYSLVSL
jgi:hypothetical protein